MKTLEYRSIISGYTEIVIASKITRLSKTADGNTCIHLDGGDCIYTDDSIKTLQARLELDK